MATNQTPAQELTPRSSDTASRPERLRFKFGIFGPALILLAFGQATGELIHWPFLMAKYGTFFLFLIPIACLLQFPLFSFLARHVVITGRSYFGSLVESNLAFGLFAWLVFLATSIWISSYTGAGGVALARLINVTFGGSLDLEASSAAIALTVNSLFFIILLTRGRTYRLISGTTQIVTFSSIILVGGFSFLAVVRRGFDVTYFTELFHWKTSLPNNWDVNDAKILLTAIIFAGLGGLWNVLYSSWVRNEGLGLPRGNADEYYESLATDHDTGNAQYSKQDYRRRMKMLHKDLAWGLGLNGLMLYLLSFVALSYRSGSTQPPAGMAIITTLGDSVSQGSMWLGLAFYVMIALFLLDTWLTAADSLAKVHSNFFLSVAAKLGVLTADPAKTARLGYVIALAGLWAMTFISSFVAQPQTLIFLNGVLSGLGSILLILGLIFTEHRIRRQYSWAPPASVAAWGLGLSFAFYLVVGLIYLALEL